MRFLSALVLFASVEAFACPDLTGTFICTNDDGSQEVTSVSQSVNKDGITVYSISGDELPADNIVKQIPDDESLKQGAYRVWCDDTSALKIQITGKIYDQGNFYGDLTYDQLISINAAGDLEQNGSGVIKNSAGKQRLDPSKTVCKRN